MSSLFQSKYDSTDDQFAPDHLYLTASLYNNRFLDPTLPQPVPAELSQTRSSPFIFNPSQYNLTIARFAISPDLIPRVSQDVNTTTSNTFLYAGLSYNDVYYDEPIVLPTVLAPDGSTIKALYSIQAFVDLINDAWTTAYASVVGAGGPTGTGSIFMSYDNTQGFYTVNVPNYYGTGGTGAGTIGVHMSLALYGSFGSFNVIQPLGPRITYNHHEITFIKEWTGTNRNADLSYPNGTVEGIYMQLRQDAPWPSSVMDIHRLIITTSSLPVYQDFLAPINPIQMNTQTIQGNNAALSIVTDFYCGHDLELEGQSETLRYVPTGLYRLISLSGSAPITRWDLKIFYQTADGNIYPLYIPVGGECSVKLLFLKKGLTS